MATPQPPLTPDQRLAQEQKVKYDRIVRNVSIGGIIICPILALLPPRKLDLYTFGLGVGWYLSADQLAQSYNGRPLIYQLSWKLPIRELPSDKAKEVAKINREREEAERVRKESIEALAGGKSKEQERGLLQRAWMGDETEGWRERRMEEERKALEEGKSYGDMIIEQIWEVWNWDKKKGSDGKNDGKVEDKKDR